MLIGTPDHTFAPSRTGHNGARASTRPKLTAAPRILTLSLLLLGCGGSADPTSADCSTAGCGVGGALSAGGAASTALAGRSGATTTAASGGYATIQVGGASGIIVIPPRPRPSALGESTIVTTATDTFTQDALSGISFGVTKSEGTPTFDWHYRYPATPSTDAFRTSRQCGWNEELRFTTCEQWQAGCIFVSVDLETMLASASFLGPDNVTRDLYGKLEAVEAPLAPVAEPPVYGLVGTFEFIDSLDSNVTLQGSFGILVRSSTTATSYLVIC